MANSASQLGASVDALEKAFDIIAHNMANANTVGFKRRCNSFTQAMAAQGNGSEGTTGAAARGVRFLPGHARADGPHAGRGAVRQGLLRDREPGRTACTRGTGSSRRTNGQIVDTMGRLVAGTAGPLLVPPGVDALPDSDRRRRTGQRRQGGPGAIPHRGVRGQGEPVGRRRSQLFSRPQGRSSRRTRPMRPCGRATKKPRT